MPLHVSSTMYMTMYLVVSAFTSCPVALLTITKASIKQTKHKASNSIKMIWRLRKCTILIPIPNIFRLFLHFMNVNKSEAASVVHLWSRRYKQRKPYDWETFRKPIPNEFCSCVATQYAQSSLQYKPGKKGQCWPHWLALVLAMALDTDFGSTVTEYLIQWLFWMIAAGENNQKGNL